MGHSVAVGAQLNMSVLDPLDLILEFDVYERLSKEQWKF